MRTPFNPCVSSIAVYVFGMWPLPSAVTGSSAS